MIPDITIRGENGFDLRANADDATTNPNAPLYILDGVEVSAERIYDMDLNRVESTTILKDASATALYGSRGANGVIVITTIRPKAGQIRINLNANYNVSIPDLRDYNLMNAEEKLQFELLSGLYQSWGPDGYLGSVEQERKYNMRLQEVRRGVDTYWMNEPLRFATTHKHNLFLEGGDGVMRYGVGVSYGKTQGVMKGSDRDVLNGNVRLIYRKGRVAFTNSLNVDYTRAERESVSFKRFAQTNPYYRKTDENGEPVKVLESFSYFDINTFRIINENVYGPFYDLSNTNFDRTHTLGITNNFEADWRVIDELRIRARIGVNKSNEQAEKFSSPFNSEFVGKEDNEKGAYTESEKHVFGYDGDLSVTYGKLLAERHMVNAVAGMRFTQSTSNLNGYTMRGFIDDEFSNPSFAQEYNPDKKVYQDVKKRTASYYVNLGYAYDNRYLLDANWRADGASIFGVNKLFTNTWSVGLGWNIHNEHFLEGAGWLDMLKLKGSWGTLGNQNLDRAYPAEPLLTNAYSAVFGTPSAIYPGYQLAYLPNPKLRWEKVEAWEAGAEANFLRNRLHFEGVYYKKKTKDLLAEVPGISGTVPGIGNLGSIENSGVELALSWRDRIGDWNYNIGMNLATIKNKVLSLVQEGYSIIAGDKQQSYTMAGYPIGYFYGYKVEGVYQTQEEIEHSPKNTLATVTPGDLKFRDVNGDGEITTADRTMIGNPTPDVTYGFTLGLGYKNWELAVDMMGQGGNQIYRTWDNYNWSQFNFMEQRMDRWHGEGTSNTQPLLNTKHTINNLNSEYYIEDGSFFRIRNVSLAYNFDKALISKIGMQALKLYVNIQNLKTWKHNTGYTPELGGSAIAFGVDDGSYPMPAIYTFGFNLTF